MTIRRLLGSWPATAIVIVSAALLAPHAAAVTWKFHPEEQSQVEVNGEKEDGARLLVTDAPGTYLVDLPFESKCVLVDVRSRSAILLMRNESQRVRSKSQGDIILVDRRSAFGTPSYTVRSSGSSFEFQTDISWVRVTLPQPRSEAEADAAAQVAAPQAAPAPESPAVVSTTLVTGPQDFSRPPAASDAARACVRLETVPSSLTPACRTSVYLRNSCDAPVVALIRQTQHLMSGTLSEALSILAPPRGSQWVGCSWWSGAMAPAMHQLIVAGFPEPPPDERVSCRGRR